MIFFACVALALTMQDPVYASAHTRMGAKKNYILSQCTQDNHIHEGKTDIAVSQWATVCYMLSWGQVG